MNDKTLSIVLRQKDELMMAQMLFALEEEGFIKRLDEQNLIILYTFWVDNRDRNSPRYRAWRESVFKRDRYKCVVCGSNTNIEAHHIEHWAKSKEKRYDVDNGVTLCRSCHYKVHGKKARMKKGGNNNG